MITVRVLPGSPLERMVQDRERFGDGGEGPDPRAAWLTLRLVRRGVIAQRGCATHTWAGLVSLAREADEGRDPEEDLAIDEVNRALGFRFTM